MERQQVSEEEALKVGKRLKIDFDQLPFKEWLNGMNTELEHSNLVSKTTDVTKGNLMKTGRIALAHLIEMPDYYTRLSRMEKTANKYWTDRPKPNILKS